MKKLLTDRLLRALMREPPGKRTILWDSAVPGLCVIATSAGKVTFAAIRRLPGTKTPLTRRGGAYPITSLSAGRNWAREALGDMARGIDPKTKEEAMRETEARRRANSFAAVAEEFIERHVSKLRSSADVEAAVRRELISRWGERPITNISRRDVVTFLEEIADSGRPAAARKIHAHMSKLFAWAIARGLYGLEISPCAAVRPSSLIGAPAARQRVLNDAEIRALWQATECLGYPAGPFIKMLLLTGQRLREVAQMSWREIDFDKGLWTIGPERMKSGAAHEVPLAPAAVEILKSLPRWHGDFVFSTTGGDRPISGFSKMKLRIDAAIGGQVDAWRFHDLRRTLRTGLGALPIPANVAELCIGHVQLGMHKIYDRHSYRAEKLRAFTLWAARLAEIVEPGASDNVVRLRTI